MKRIKVNDEEIDKIYFHMGEAQKMVGVDGSRIRFWLDYFKMEVGYRTNNNHRMFTRTDISILNHIKFLSDTGEYTLLGIYKRVRRRIEARNIVASRKPVQPPESRAQLQSPSTDVFVVSRGL